MEELAYLIEVLDVNRLMEHLLVDVGHVEFDLRHDGVDVERLLIDKSFGILDPFSRYFLRFDLHRHLGLHVRILLLKLPVLILLLLLLLGCLSSLPFHELLGS